VELLVGFITFCHSYRWHSSVCQFYTRSFIIAITNSETHTLLPLSLMWHARWACQRGSEPGSPHLAREMTYLPMLLLSLYSLTCGPHMSASSSTSSHHHTARGEEELVKTACRRSASSRCFDSIHVNLGRPSYLETTATNNLRVRAAHSRPAGHA